MDEKWWRKCGSFHAKAILGLYRLYELTNKPQYLDYASRLAEYALREQQKCGRFLTQSNEESTHLHPHLYTLEGLLCFGILKDDSELINWCRKGLEWVLNSQLEDGTIYSFYKDGQFVPFVRTDVLAQTLRLAAILLQHKKLSPQLKPTLDQLRKRLLDYQILAGNQTGAFFYGQEQNGTVHYHANAWATMFAAQALFLYDRADCYERSPYRFSFFV